MKVRKFLILLMVLILLVYGSKHILLSKLTLLTNSETTQRILLPDMVKDISVHDKFQALIERWKLTDLLPEGCTMTIEQQNDFITYFQQFDNVIRNYIILLLQLSAVDTTTLNYGTNDHTGGVYLMYCQYCLYDMNQDGFPEFILETGACEADFQYTVYTIVDGKLINCGKLSGSHSSLYTNGSGKFVRYACHMGVYDIDVSTLEGTTLKTQKIADGSLDYEKNEDYPPLDQYGYGDYNQTMSFSVIPTLFLAAAG